MTGINPLSIPGEADESEAAEQAERDAQAFWEYDPAVHGLDTSIELDADVPHPGSPSTNGESRELAVLRSALIVGDAIKNLPPPSPLIEGVLDQNSSAELFGASGSYKTFIALSFGLCVVTGTPWLGHPVHQGPVLYVVAEGIPGIAPRVAAWQDYWHVEDIDSMLWLPRTVNLLDPDWADALVEVARERETVLVIVETLARAMPGGNENASEDMGRMVAALDRIRAATQATTLPVHHTGKDQSAGSRGHSSFKAAMDTELLVEKDHGRVFLKAEKQRDHPDGHVIETLRIVERCGSCVLDEHHGEPDDRDAEDEGRITAGFVTAAVLAVTRLYEIDGEPGPTRNKVRDALRADEVKFDDRDLSPALLRAVAEGRLTRTPRRGGGDYYAPAGGAE